MRAFNSLLILHSQVAQLIRTSIPSSLKPKHRLEHSASLAASTGFALAKWQKGVHKTEGSRNDEDAIFKKVYKKFMKRIVITFHL